MRSVSGNSGRPCGRERPSSWKPSCTFPFTLPIFAKQHALRSSDRLASPAKLQISKRKYLDETVFSARITIRKYCEILDCGSPAAAFAFLTRAQEGFFSLQIWLFRINHLQVAPPTTIL